MKNFLRLSLCLSLSLFVVARATSPAKQSSPLPKTHKADAKTLLQAAKKATAVIIKNARADKDLDPKEPRNKPFWRVVQTMTKRLKAAETGLAAKTNDFFKGVTDARKAEEQMKLAWQLTDSKNKSVIDNGKALGNALAILRANFSKEALRKKQGGELTPIEKIEFAKIKADQKVLLKRISEVKREGKRDRALVAGLREIEKQANQVLKQPDTLDAYVATLYLLDTQVGLVRGYQFYVHTNLREDWFVVDQLEANYESSYVAWQQSVTYDWANLNTTVDIPDGQEVDVSDEISDQEINSQVSYVENESFELSEMEQEEVATEANNDPDIVSASASDDEEQDMNGDQDDDDGGNEDGGG